MPARSGASRRFTAIPVLSAIVLAAGCTPPAAPSGPAWRQLPQPAGVQVVQLATLGDAVVLGGYEPSAPVKPSLWRWSAATGLVRIPVTAVSGYAPDALWTSLGSSGPRLLAIGGAPGGAHANTRWTVWEGSVSGLVEQPQSFDTFGGWGAGTLVGVAFAGAEPFIAGSWGSRSAGLDLAVWRLAGSRWRRADATGTPLASTATRLVQGVAVASAPDGAVVVGSTVRLRAGVDVRPAAWHAPSPRGPWTLVELPLPPAVTQARAEAVVCADTSCLILGRAAERLVAWTLRAGRADIVADVPAIPLAVGVPTVAFAAGWAIAAATPSGAAVIRQTETGWATSPLPDGTPVALIGMGTRLVVSLRQPASTTLWTSP